MKHATDRIVLCNFCFLLLLSLSAELDGVLGESVYLLAFILPSALGLYLLRGRTDRGFRLLPSAAAFCDTLPFYPITVALVFLLSFLTSLALGALGLENETVLKGTLWKAFFSHALLPALLEELLFRYLPLKALLPYGKRRAVLLCALFFSLAHCNLFQIPYAFAAGVLFALVDIMTGSVLPSVLLHLFNNALGVLWIYYGGNGAFALPFLITLSVLFLIGIALLLLRRTHYLSSIKEILRDPCDEKPSHSVYLATALCLFIALTNLFL